MKILLVGGGGREHAIGWKLAQDPAVTAVVSTPGNPGLSDVGETIDGVDIEDGKALADLARSVAADLVVIGPEAPLAAGVADVVRAAGVAVFGPSRLGARLEASKAYAKEVMQRAGVPTGNAEVFTDIEAAVDHLRTIEPPYVVKADGLAAGKGVLVTPDLVAAEAWAQSCLKGTFGAAGATVVVEEFLEGEEVSVFAICDGTTAVPLQPARDYKRLKDGNRGPNTGGMGCFSPVADLDPTLVATTMTDVVEPVLDTLAAAGSPFQGFLYAGLVLTRAGPKVLEFNVRLGDPETQVLMPRLDEPLGELLMAGATGSLDRRPLRWSHGAAVDVVLAAGGYPESPRRGDVITGIDEAGRLDHVQIFHAGTSRVGDDLVTGGGRVLNVVGTGPTIEVARSRAYDAARSISFAGMQYRTDIASSG